jgi:DNA end-binding protein Ku
MAQAIWKGSVSFGLVNIPVSLYSGETREELHFSLLDSRDKSPIGYKKINKNTGQEVPKESVVRAFELDDGEYVVVGEADLKKAAPERTQRIEIKAFVDAAQIDPAYFDRPYYLEPAAKSDKVYALLREAMARAGKAGIATVVIRAREYLCALMPRGAALMLELLRYPYELRSPDEFHLPDADSKSVKVTETELKMAERLIKDLEDDWDPAAYKDEYREKLLAFIERKAKEGRAFEIEAPGKQAEKKLEPAADVMALLKASVAHAETAKRKGGHRGRLLH